MPRATSNLYVEHFLIRQYSSCAESEEDKAETWAFKVDKKHILILRLLLVERHKVLLFFELRFLLKISCHKKNFTFSFLLVFFCIVRKDTSTAARRLKTCFYIKIHTFPNGPKSVYVGYEGFMLNKLSESRKFLGKWKVYGMGYRFLKLLLM